ncbi:MAG: formylglycine-generating enzyme family protein, partial [bacterium]|nr:formylglycine-generating enzyme family protein [bacterium]
DADRLLFTMPVDGRYRVFEIGAAGEGIRQITPDDQPDVDNFDAAYLPNGKVIFGGNASYQAVPCWHGLQTVACLFSINADGTGMRQLTFDQDEDSHPTVLNSGQVLFCRWEYTNTPHAFPHLLFAMNPDGTSQREFYGSGSYWPNAIYYPRAIPDEPTKIVGVVSGYHGDYRMGELFLIDPARGRSGASGMVQKIPDRGDEIKVRIKDRLTSASWPKFLQPHPLSDKYFLVSAKPTPNSLWGLYLVDIYDNMLLLREERGYVLFEPVARKKTPRPPILPDRIDPDSKNAIVYLADVHAGPGLKGVPRGSVKKLRVFSYNYSYRDMGGLLGTVGMDGPWDIKRV